MQGQKSNSGKSGISQALLGPEQQEVEIRNRVTSLLWRHPGPAAVASPENLCDMQISGPTPDLLTQKFWGRVDSSM